MGPFIGQTIKDFKDEGVLLTFEFPYGDVTEICHRIMLFAFIFGQDIPVRLFRTVRIAQVF